MPKQQEEPLIIRALTFHSSPSPPVNPFEFSRPWFQNRPVMWSVTFNLDSSCLHFPLNEALAIFLQLISQNLKFIKISFKNPFYHTEMSQLLNDKPDF